MKKAIYLSFIFLFTISLQAQKKEVKAAEKALKKGDLTTAENLIKQACELKNAADAKTQAKIMLIKGKVYQAKAQTNPEDLEKAVDAYLGVLKIEKQNKFEKYSQDAQKYLEDIKINLFKKLKNANDNKKYGEALAYMQLIYKIEPTDDNLYTLALLQLYNKQNEEAYNNLKKLYESGYTGVKKLYLIDNKETGETLNAGSEKMMKLMAKNPQYTNPRVEETKSKRSELISNMLYALNRMGKDQEAFDLIQKAKQEDPDNVDLLIGEANYYLKKNDNKKFAEVMEKAFKLDPTNPNFAYNVAIGYLNVKNYEKAKEYFNKTLELDPNYKNAYYGLALVELGPEEELVEEINKNLNNPRKYDQLKTKQKELYLRALPYLEKYYEMDPDDINVVRILKNFYIELEVMDKYKEMKAKLKELKSKQ